MFLSLSQNLKHKSPNLSYTVKTFDLSCYIKQLIQNYVIFTQNQTLFSDITHIQLMHKHYTAVITHYRDKCKTLHSGQSRGTFLFIMKYLHNPAHIYSKCSHKQKMQQINSKQCLGIILPQHHASGHGQATGPHQRHRQSCPLLNNGEIIL